MFEVDSWEWTKQRAALRLQKLQKTAADKVQVPKNNDWLVKPATA